MSKITERQKCILVKFMETHLHLARSQTDNSVNADSLWRQLSSILNCQEGPKKTVKKWKKSWCDIRVDAKRKLSATNHGEDTVSAKAAKIKTLTPIDLRVLAVLGYDVDGEQGASGKEMRFPDIENEVVFTSEEVVAKNGLKETEDAKSRLSSRKRKATDSSPKRKKLSERSVAEPQLTGKWLELELKKAAALQSMAENMGRMASVLDDMGANIRLIAASLQTYNYEIVTDAQRVI